MKVWKRWGGGVVSIYRFDNGYGAEVSRTTRKDLLLVQMIEFADNGEDYTRTHRSVFVPAEDAAHIVSEIQKRKRVGRCQDCKTRHGTRMANPYTLELYRETCFEILCEVCEQEFRDAI